ncbi:MAG TPA: murein biosynthesis integral membrane protein MurJ, partial [Chthoniobacterales bacterium]
EKEGDAPAWALASKMLTLAAVFMSGISLLGVLFARPLIGLLAPGFAPEDAALTIWLTQIMYPFILLVSLAALVMGMLNSKNIFGVPAMASSFFNLGSIIGGVWIGWSLDPRFGETALTGLAIGTLAGGLLQFAIQLPSLRKAGFRFRPDFRWKDEGVRKILILMIPSVIAASAVQVNVMVNSSFASIVGKEAVAWLNSAFRFMQMPLGMFGVAVATITLPVISRIAAHADRSDFGPTLGKAMRLSLFLTLPSAAGLAVLAEPIINLIYRWGAYTASDVSQTAHALRFYVAGLVAYACIKVLSPAFYALDRKWTPMIVSFASIGVNLGLNYLFIFKFGWGHWGLALSTSLSATGNFLALYGLMHGHAGTLATRRLLTSALKCGFASLALAAAGWGLLIYLREYLFHPNLIFRAAATLGSVGLCGAVYAAACWLLRVEEMRTAFDAILRKVRRR